MGQNIKKQPLYQKQKLVLYSAQMQKNKVTDYLSNPNFY